LKIRPSALVEDSIHIWWVALYASDAGEKAFESILSDQEKLRSRSFVNSSLRRRFTLSRGVLRVLLSRYLDACPQDIVFGYGPAGKPFMKNEEALIEFNVSHSDDMAAYVFGNHSRLGIDIERSRPMPDLEGVAKLTFSQQEYSELLTVTEPGRNEAFFRCWTRKEAYVKATGQGVSLAFESFQVSFRPEQPAALRSLPPGDSCRNWQIRDISQREYVGAVVFDGKCQAVEQQLPCVAEDLADFRQNCRRKRTPVC
jgi:4'-phosphopantetheinyl transferase